MKPHLLGTMVISMDVELSWGRFDKVSLGPLNAQSMEERPRIRRLLNLLDRYQIPVTWAITGHLMLDGCSRGENSHPHEDIVPRPAYSWFPSDWYAMDPCTPASQSPCWYAPDVVEWIKNAQTPHEIGSHSFGHIPYGDPETTAATAGADLRAAIKAAEKKGVVLKSFVFPRNLVGHLSILQRGGICAFRGSESVLDRGNDRGIIQRTCHFLDQLLGLTPTAVYPSEALPGLWNIPGNHFFMGRDGIRRFVPMASRILKARRGIDRAVKNGGLYHLWMHPCNLILDSNAMFAGLETVLSYAHQQRSRGLLQILTMGDYARWLQSEGLQTKESSLRPTLGNDRASMTKRNRAGLRVVGKSEIGVNR